MKFVSRIRAPRSRNAAMPKQSPVFPKNFRGSVDSDTQAPGRDRHHRELQPRAAAQRWMASFAARSMQPAARRNAAPILAKELSLLRATPVGSQRATRNPSTFFRRRSPDQSALVREN